MSFYLITDLETVRDPDIDRDVDPEAGPRVDAPPHHQIVSFGTLLLGSRKHNFRPIRIRTDDELEGLRSFIQTTSDTRVKVVTFAGRVFDMPIIVARALRRGLPFKRFFLRGGGDMRYRYGGVEGAHIDLMDQFSEYGASVRPRMGACTQLVGFPGKRGMDGSMVAEYVAQGRLEEVKIYNMEDLASAAGLFLRYLFLAGEVTHVSYGHAATELLAFLDTIPALGPFVAAINRPQFLEVDSWMPTMREDGRSAE